jgi:3-oxoadipate enol-lactonase
MAIEKVRTMFFVPSLTFAAATGQLPPKHIHNRRAKKVRTHSETRRIGLIGILLLVCAWFAVPFKAASAQVISGTVPVGRYGHELYYEVEGEGEPVVLIHGLTFDLSMWDAQMDALTEHYQVIRYDAVGHGRSSGLEGDVPFGSVLQWDYLRDLLDALEIEKAHVVGLSMGGGVAMDFAIVHPQRVETMTSLGGVLEGYQWISTPGEAADRFNDYYDASRTQGVEAAMPLWLADPQYAPAMANPDLRAQLEEMVIEGHGGLGESAMFQYPNLQKIGGLDAISRLDEIEAPSLVMIGELELRDLHIMADIVDRDIPDSTKIVVPAAGHMTNMEQPDFVNAALLDFLAAHPIVPTLPDYDGNGLVEQGDLDLVLLNWGRRPSNRLLASVGWVNDRPTGPFIDQQELDKVLVHWGSGTGNIAVSSSAVPEPTALAIVLIALLAIATAHRSH